MYSLKTHAVLAMNAQVIYLLLLCLSLTCIVMLLLAVREVVRTIRFLRTSLRTEGTIVRLDPRRNSEGSIKHHAVVSFKTFDNQDHEIQASISHTTAPEVGIRVTVRYLPESPKTGKIENFWELWETSFFYFVFFFAMFFFFSILIMIISTA